ncbi:hypothetical protein AMECASPLE_022765 [Ameca splendens]|uniref:Uncharacterized protein n=1 Tax=Ameca splendens TaxID=208324 RepID=A0ABV0YG06_9TELE
MNSSFSYLIFLESNLITKACSCGLAKWFVILFPAASRSETAYRSRVQNKSGSEEVELDSFLKDSTKLLSSRQDVSGLIAPKVKRCTHRVTRKSLTRLMPR